MQRSQPSHYVQVEVQSSSGADRDPKVLPELRVAYNALCMSGMFMFSPTTMARYSFNTGMLHSSCEHAETLASALSMQAQV